MSIFKVSLLRHASVNSICILLNIEIFYWVELHYKRLENFFTKLLQKFLKMSCLLVAKLKQKQFVGISTEGEARAA